MAEPLGPEIENAATDHLGEIQSEERSAGIAGPAADAFGVVDENALALAQHWSVGENRVLLRGDVPGAKFGISLKHGRTLEMAVGRHPWEAGTVRNGSEAGCSPRIRRIGSLGPV